MNNMGRFAPSSGSWEKNKRYAEQAAALAAIACLGLEEEVRPATSVGPPAVNGSAEVHLSHQCESTMNRSCSSDAVAKNNSSSCSSSMVDCTDRNSPSAQASASYCRPLNSSHEVDTAKGRIESLPRGETLLEEGLNSSDIVPVS
jgi:hypothetical protein